ncbi:MAG: DUF4835 family protein [Schleiferiaceae bacterium]|nr:DUF4835 family protein [Schleiferiaceae bacterium]
MTKYFLSLITGLFFSTLCHSQELNATVQILHPSLQMSNQELVPNMQKALENLINFTAWTNEFYEVEERIECSFILTLDAANGTNYSGSLQVSYSRPVFNSNYKSPVLNYIDNDVDFTYIENQPLEYVENQNASNTVSLVSFFAYIIIGLDKDTYALNGGQQYLLKAQNIVNLAQSTNNKGWKSFDGSKNRFWLIDNILNTGFSEIRDCYYNYHRQGLDLMYDETKQANAKKTISQSVIALQNIYQKRPNAFILQVFFDAKSDEIVNIFKGGPSMDTGNLVNVLKQIDAGRNTKYDAINKR